MAWSLGSVDVEVVVMVGGSAGAILPMVVRVGMGVASGLDVTKFATISFIVWPSMSVRSMVDTGAKDWI